MKPTSFLITGLLMLLCSLEPWGEETSYPPKLFEVKQSIVSASLTVNIRSVSNDLAEQTISNMQTGMESCLVPGFAIRSFTPNGFFLFKTRELYSCSRKGD